MTVDAQQFESGAMRFELAGAALRDGVAGARLGRLSFKGRRAIDTPNYIAITSRGTVPHLTPDNVGKHLQVGGAYMALEDFIEKPQQNSKRVPPIFSAPTTTRHQTPLHSFTAMPPSVTTVLSARRLPAVPSPMGNTNNGISVFTSTGFQALTTKDYLSAARTLQPDIAIPLADLTHGPAAPNSKRALRMVERTDEWAVEWFSSSSSSDNPNPDPLPTATFAPVLPVPYSLQWEYLARLAEDYLPTGQLSGLALHDPDLLADLSSHCPSLLPLPRLSLGTPPTPHHILRQVALGVDLFAVPFVNALSDAGLALDFCFPLPSPSPSSSSKPLPLAIDLSSAEHATSLSPLSTTFPCPCYACAVHHRAYVRHLLAAREMLGWALLQVHNHAVLAGFFAGVRAVLRGVEGGEEEGFEAARRRFALAYEADFPEGLAERPRARGYQYKSVGGGEGRRNKPAWGKLNGGGDGGGEGADSGKETPVVPVEEGAAELEGKGFAEIRN